MILNWLRDWNWVRIFRLVVGIAALVQGILYHNNVLGMMGVILLAQAVFNMGCCGASGCAVPQRKSANKTIESKEVEYEELV